MKTCITCEANRAPYPKQVGLLRPLPIQDGPWECVSMDFITSLPESRGCDPIFVVVDRFCKLAKDEANKRDNDRLSNRGAPFQSLVAAP